MTLKLALRNVRRSARDYTIYFATITLGVAIFYAFNAISGQAALLDALSADSKRMIDLLSLMMGVFSILVAGVLGFLVVYANRYLVRRRKREFGNYLMLGMRPGRVSAILACETLLVGIAALATGLVLGIIASQGLSFATAALMGTTMTKYQFVINGQAIVLTALCFAAIFAVSAVVDVLYIRKSKLANLLSAHQGSEQLKPVSMPLSASVFVASLAVLGVAYWQFKLNGMQLLDSQFVLSAVLMVIGTFGFFWSATGFVLGAIRCSKGAYYHGMVAFTLRQISSKVNTAFLSMGVVSVLLFFAITSTCVGTGLYDLFVGSMRENTQYDMTLVAQSGALGREGNEDAQQRFASYDGDIEACLKNAIPTWGEFVKDSAQLDYYAVGSYAGPINQVPNASSLVSDQTLESMKSTPMNVVSVSQYNAVCALTGAPQISLAADECAINNLPGGYDELAQAFIDNAASLQIAGEDLHFAGSVQHQAMRTSAIADVALEIIVPDHVTAALKATGETPVRSNLDIMYVGSRAQGDQAFTDTMTAAFPVPGGGTIKQGDGEPVTDYTFETSAWPVWSAYGGTEMADQATGLGMVITYLTIYIGFVLLIATAAVLAVQQLSETTDSLGRYRRLSTIGCPEKSVLESLKAQTWTYFLAPLFLAACHSAWATHVVNGTLFNELGVSMIGGITTAAVMTVVVYGAYLLISLHLSKAMVKQVLV